MLKSAKSSGWYYSPAWLILCINTVVGAVITFPMVRLLHQEWFHVVPCGWRGWYTTKSLYCWREVLKHPLPPHQLTSTVRLHQSWQSRLGRGREQACTTLSDSNWMLKESKNISTNAQITGFNSRMCLSMAHVLCIRFLNVWNPSSLIMHI